MENYLRFKLLGGQLLLKKDVVPHIFDRKRTTASTDDEVPVVSKRRRLLLVKQENEAEEQDLVYPVPSTAPDITSFGQPLVSEKVRHRSVSVQVHIRPTMRSKYVQCELKPNQMHNAVSPIVFKETGTKTIPHVKLESVENILVSAKSSSDLGDVSAASINQPHRESVLVKQESY